MTDTHQLVEHFFRHEYARLVASLTRTFGVRHLNLVEDVVQSALQRALASWSLRGIPPKPAAWLHRVAHNLAIDALRRDLRWSSLDAAAAPIDVSARREMEDTEIEDHLLRMIFVCCDDAIPPEAQICLALKTLCGFGTREIARALLTSEANIQKRITRAKEKLRQTGLDPGSLTPELIQARIPNVQAVLYLLFNEGYSSSSSDQLVRKELCEEAVRLALILAEHPATKGPGTAALLALLLFHAARLGQRQDAHGSLLLLQEQDRGGWESHLLAEGFRWFGRAAAGAVMTRYHAEAWIAAEHCRAKRYEDTDWELIVQAYDWLIRLAPSPIHELNRAIALAERDGPAAGEQALHAIAAQNLPEHYYLWQATAGELARRCGRLADARAHIAQAWKQAPTQTEQDFLKRKLESLGK